MQESDYVKIKEDIATIKTKLDVELTAIKESVIRIEKHSCPKKEKINTNRKLIYFLGLSIIGIISYLTGIKLI